jgi:small-conductance mechanosensitive channel
LEVFRNFSVPFLGFPGYAIAVLPFAREVVRAKRLSNIERVSVSSMIDYISWVWMLMIPFWWLASTFVLFDPDESLIRHESVVRILVGIMSLCGGVWALAVGRLAIRLLSSDFAGVIALVNLILNFVLVGAAVLGFLFALAYLAFVIAVLLT